ncbi:MAG: tetratricopeptide repeat protein [Candidatus Omnitrophica bacterium]|nr:tetratricopeptide repeat protein [Candidatus Omnitrophota bacterium]
MNTGCSRSSGKEADMKILLVLCFLMTALIFSAEAEDWEQFVRKSMEQSPSARKRRLSSGRRLLREKSERIARIEAKAPGLIKEGDYEKAEALLKESLRLTIEIYHTRDIRTAEGFMNLGILYTRWGKPGEAESALEWCLKIGEPLEGRNSLKLAGARQLLAAAYYDQAKYAEAEKEAEKLLDLYLSHYGPRSKQAEKVKEFLKEVYKRTS